MRFGGIFSANGQLTANTSAFKSPAILGAQHNQMATGNLPFPNADGRMGGPSM